MSQQNERYNFGISVPIISITLGLSTTLFELWLVWDLPLFLASGILLPPLVPRLVILLLVWGGIDFFFLTLLMPYLRSKVAVEVSADHLLVNAKYGMLRLPRDAVMNVHRGVSNSVRLELTDAFKQRSWYGRRVDPTILTGYIIGLDADELVERIETWRTG